MAGANATGEQNIAKLLGAMTNEKNEETRGTFCLRPGGLREKEMRSR